MLKVIDCLGSRILTRRITNRPRAGILRAKWFTKLEEKEDLKILIGFKEQYTKGCYNAVIRRYFLINKLYILKELY